MIGGMPRLDRDERAATGGANLIVRDQLREAADKALEEIEAGETDPMDL